MDINYLLFLGSILFAALAYNGRYNKPNINYDNKTKRQFLIICGFIIFFMIAFRNKYNASTDSANYYDNWASLAEVHFKGLSEYIENSEMERMYLYTVWFLSKFFADPQWLFIFTGAFFSFSVCRFLYKNCDDVLLGVYVFVTMGLFNFMVQGLRQAIAMSICLFAFEYAKRRKPVRFTLVVLVALLYHKSALAFFAVYFLYGRKMKLSNVAGMSCFFFAVAMVSNVILSWGNETFGRSYSDTANSGGLVTIVIYILVIFISALLSGERKDDKNFVFFFYVTVFAMVLYISRYIAANIMERMSFFFSFGQMIMIPAISRTFRDKERKLVTVMLLLVMTAYGIYKFSTTGMTPYDFMWQSSTRIK